jgi:anti-sigma B factor antagonist
MNHIKFPIEMVRGIPVVTAPEEIDITSAGGLRAALVDSAARGQGTLVVDLTRTHFCDTAGLHALVGAHKRAQTEAGQVLLVIPDPGMLRIFAITGLDQVIPNFTSLEEALAQIPALASQPPHPPADASTETS